MSRDSGESAKERKLWDALPELVGAERGQTYFNLSLLAFERGEHTKSLALAESACECFKSCSDELGYANCMTSVAFNLIEMKRSDDAIRALLKAVINYSKVGDEQEWEYRCYLANWFQDKKEFELALKQLEICLRHYEFENFGMAISRISEQMGQVLCGLKRCEEAVERFKVSREILKQEKEPGCVAVIDLHLSCCYNHLHDAISAQAYANKAINVFASTQDSLRQAQGLAQLGKALNELSQFEEALEKLDTAHTLVTGMKSIDFFAICRIQEGKVEALRGLGRDEEAEVIERRNAAIKEIMGQD